MGRKIYVVDLDARNEAAMKKIDQVEQRLVKGVDRMEATVKRLGSAMVGAFASYKLVEFGKDMLQLGMKVEGVKRAFDRLKDSQTTLERLRKATNNTVNDLELMSAAVRADKFKIPLDLLAKGLLFAKITAADTGQEISYLVESFVTGVARKSLPILDNLAISQVELGEEVKKTGDFYQALSNVMDRTLSQAAGQTDLVIEKTEQWNTKLDNVLQTVATGAKDVWSFLLDDFDAFIGNWDFFISSVTNFPNDVARALADVIPGLEYIESLEKTSNKLRDERIDIESKFTKKQEKIVEQEKTITGEKKSQLDLTIQQYDVMEDIYDRIKEMQDEDLILGDYKSGTGRGRSKYGPASQSNRASGALKQSFEEAQEPMSALVSLSNQMASNFQFAGHTFVGQLSQAIAMVDSISNMILTVASIFGGGGGFGIGGLLGLIGLEKGGRVSNLGGSISYTKIPSFAMGGSYSTPGFAGPMAGGYPVMVHKNETLDVYNAGQTSKMERTLGEIKTILYNTGLNASRKRGGGGGGPIVIKIGDKTVAEVTQKRMNKMQRGGVNLEQL